MLDIFNSDAFSVVSLTTAINSLKHVPGRLGQLGIFTQRSVNTLTVVIEEKGGVLTLVSPTPRGGPGQTVDKAKRKMRPIQIPHFQIDDAINADEVQGIRAFGSETELETVVGKVTERLSIHDQSLAATEEYARVGAIKGIITYADNTTLNLFDVFEVDAPAEIDLDLDNAAPTPGVFRKKCAQIVRSISSAMEGTPFSGIRAECGDAFFDDLISHPEVRNTFLNTQNASELRTGYVAPAGQQSMIFASFEFGGIIWENYRGKVGATNYIDTNKAEIFPVGAPGLFQEIYGPADYVETVNTNGLPRYAKQKLRHDEKGVDLWSQTNVLEICTRPLALQQVRRT